MMFGKNIQNTVESRIEFVCFSFHVDLLVITLSSLKLHKEINACMFLLTDSVTRNFRFFVTSGDAI